MNILFLHSSSDIYGASKILIYSIRSLKMVLGPSSKMIVVLSEDGPLVEELKKLDCEVHLYDLGILRKKYQSISGIINRLIKISFAFFFLQKIVRRNQIHIIYSNTTAVIIGVFVALLSPAKHVYHIHEIIEAPRYLKSFLKFLMTFSKLNIVVSGEVEKCWNRKGNKNFKIVYNGINIEDEINLAYQEKVDLPDSQFLIGMIGRVHYWKGQSYFLKIASEVKKELDDVKFIMIGDAYPGYEYLYSEINTLKNELDLNEDVIDLGFKSNPNVYLKHFDLLILPSIKPDPFPTVILEAMSLGIPIAATAHGGALEMIKNEETGWHIPYDDHVTAGQQIVKALKKSELGMIGDKAKTRLVEQFSLEAFEKNISEAVLKIT